LKTKIIEDFNEKKLLTQKGNKIIGNNIVDTI
jgi:hypothetical protein